MGYSQRPPKEGYERPPASMVMMRIGGHDYPLHSEPNCKTCQSPHRIMIENLLLEGKTYAGVAKELLKFEDEGVLGHPNRDNIAHHCRQRHMPLPHAVQRELMDRQAEKLGKRVEDEAESLVDQHTVASRVMTVGFEALIQGEIAPTVAETLAAAKLVQDIESKSEVNADQEAMVTAMIFILEECRKTMSLEQWNAFSRTLSTNPILKAIGQKQAPKEIEGEVLS